MQARHLCEDHLFAAIENRDQDYAEKLVRMIQSYQAEKKPLLTAKNDQGKSFLYLAMENKLEILADTLYHYLKNNHSLLFDITNDKRSLIHAAVLSGSIELLKKYIHLFEKDQQDWMTADNSGATPLHLAIHPARVACLEYLAKKIIKTCPHKMSLLNRDGETALTLALKMTATHYPIDYRIIIPFAVMPDLWKILDNENCSAITYFAKKTIGFQQIVLNHLKIEERQQLLRSYRELVLQDQTFLSNYFRLCGLDSLTTLAAAHCEFDQKVPLVATNKIPPDILMMIPLYEQRLFKQNRNPISRNILVKYDEFTEARLWLNELIKEVSDYHQHLLTQQPTYQHIKYGPLAIFVTMATIVSLFLIIIESTNISRKNNDNYNNEVKMLALMKVIINYADKLLTSGSFFQSVFGPAVIIDDSGDDALELLNNYRHASKQYSTDQFYRRQYPTNLNDEIMGVVIGIVIFFASYTYSFITFRKMHAHPLPEKNYSHSNHLAMINYLQKELIDRLMTLPNDQRLASDVDIQKIQQELTNLATDHLLQDTINSVANLETSLKKMRGEACVSSKLILNLFAKKKKDEVSINVGELSADDSLSEDSSAEEKKSFIPKY